MMIVDTWGSKVKAAFYCREVTAACILAQGLLGARVLFLMCSGRKKRERNPTERNEVA